jgi:ABC-type uncharacterized transport system ATPase component
MKIISGNTYEPPNQKQHGFLRGRRHHESGCPQLYRKKADRELYEHILKGDFCCVLTPRQMGKSSLMTRTADRLKKEGIRTAIIDLTQIGTEKEKTSADKWYYGIAYRIVKELGIKTNLNAWWEKRERLLSLQRANLLEMTIRI